MLSLQVTVGEVRATVQGSRVKPYMVRIGLATFRDSVWAKVERRLASQALFSARLLAGELPGEIEAVFDAAGAPLFPQALRDLAMSCSCPDSAVPCKHLAATFYLLAEAFDDDPFQVLLWRGRSREELLSRLRTLRDGEEHRERNSEQDALGEGEERRGARRNSAGRHQHDALRDGEERRESSKSSNGGERRQDGKRRKGGEQGEHGEPREGGEQPEAAQDDAPFGAAAALRELPEVDVSEQLDRFWLSPVPLTGKRQPVLAVEPDLLLRQLPTPGQRLGGRALVDALRLLYKRIG